MGQAKRRGSLEDRIQQAQTRGADRYPDQVPPVTLRRLTVDSPAEWIRAWQTANADYLSSYRARGTQPTMSPEQAAQLVQESTPEWLSQEHSHVNLAFNDRNEIVGYVTTHTGPAAVFHADSTESLIEDIYVIPQHRHQGYMTAIRTAANTQQILVDKIKLRALVGYYVRAGFRSFNVHYYGTDNSFPQQMTMIGLMKSNVSVRRDGKGLYALNLKDIDLAIDQDRSLLQVRIGRKMADRYTQKEPA